VPLDWAMTQNNLGTVLWTLGAREGSAVLLAEAVQAYRAALEEWTRDRVPLDWATTQNNLGTALATLGAREGSAVRLQEAVQAYRAALEEYTRDRVPLEWAMSYGNQGVALRALAGLTRDPGLAQQALDQITAAGAQMREGGHLPHADLYARQIPVAQALLDELRRR